MSELFKVVKLSIDLIVPIEIAEQGQAAVTEYLDQHLYVDSEFYNNIDTGSIVITEETLIN